MCLNTHRFTRNTWKDDNWGGGIGHRHRHGYWNLFADLLEGH